MTNISAMYNNRFLIVKKICIIAIRIICDDDDLCDSTVKGISKSANTYTQVTTTQGYTKRQIF